MTPTAAIRVAGVSHWYDERQALDGVSFEVPPAEIFGLLGPNGGGKSTLFRILSTLLPLSQGEASILGRDLRQEVAAIRRQIGVVFQSPSVDRKLTVAENLFHQGHLYGLSGSQLKQRSREMLARFGLEERSRERVETLSGGLRRRVELAKGLLHRPRLLLLDEPSTGLDPAARSDMWEHLRQVRRDDGVTILLTTHLLEEADKADRLAILDRGRLVALDAPDALRASVGGDAITIAAPDPHALGRAIRDRFSLEGTIVEGSLRLEMADGHQWIARLVEAFPGQIESITLGKPTLEDVFIARTGRRLELAETAS